MRGREKSEKSSEGRKESRGKAAKLSPHAKISHAVVALGFWGEEGREDTTESERAPVYYTSQARRVRRSATAQLRPLDRI